MAQADYVSNAIRALITGAGAKPSTNPVRAAHAEFVATLAGHPPWPIPLEPRRCRPRGPRRSLEEGA